MVKSSRQGPYVCGIDVALDVVSGKWKGLIMWELAEHGTLRFAELGRAVPGVSDKMLTQHLRELEQDDLVTRRVYPEVPPRVEYSLTAEGLALNEALIPLGDWGHSRIERRGIPLVEHLDAEKMPRPA